VRDIPQLADGEPARLHVSIYHLSKPKGRRNANHPENSPSLCDLPPRGNNLLLSMPQMLGRILYYFILLLFFFRIQRATFDHSTPPEESMGLGKLRKKDKEKNEEKTQKVATQFTFEEQVDLGSYLTTPVPEQEARTPFFPFFFVSLSQSR